MGLTKTEYYTEQQIDLAKTLKVLGHPARLSILQSIAKTKACVCGELVTEIGLAQATISQHLKELKSVGLIKGTIEGKSMCYCIDMDKWNLIQDEFSSIFNTDSCDTDCC